MLPLPNHQGYSEVRPYFISRNYSLALTWPPLATILARYKMHCSVVRKCDEVLEWVNDANRICPVPSWKGWQDYSDCTRCGIHLTLRSAALRHHIILMDSRKMELHMTKRSGPLERELCTSFSEGNRPSLITVTT